MKSPIHYSLNNFWRFFRINFWIILAINIFFLKNSYCRTASFDPLICKYSMSLKNKDCFNNVIKFKHKKYLSNNFALSSNGDFITEFTEYTKYDELSYSRLFYGFTKEGRYFLSNQSSFTDEKNIDIDENEYNENELFYHHAIYNSKNFFVTMKNEPTKKNQYLFGINAYNSMVELHDLNKTDNNYHIWSLKKFFNLNEKEYYWPYEFELFELKKESAYIIAFIPTFEIYEEIGQLSFIKKFRFQSFDENAYKEINSVKYEDYIESRITNTFLMDDLSTFVVLAYKYLKSGPQIPEKFDVDLNRRISVPSSLIRIYLNFYNYNLTLLSYAKEMEIKSPYLHNCNLDEVFIKSLYLNKKNVLFIYNNWEKFTFELFELDYQRKNNILLSGGKYTSNTLDFDIYESKSDFVKINNNKAAFIYTGFTKVGITRGGGKKQLPHNRVISILIINIVQYGEISAREYNIDLDRYTTTMKISGFLYNGHLLISSIVKKKEGNNFHDSSDELLSLFMIFGYSNGTDSIIDISQYFYKEDESQMKDLFNLLYENFTLENNIFGYYPSGLIKLVSVPKEIEIIAYDFEEKEKHSLDELKRILDEFNIQLDFPVIFCYRIGENGECNNEWYYIIESNNELMKTSQYYYIDYQYLVIEPTEQVDAIQPIQSGNEQPFNRILGVPNFNFYYGRENRLKFKLCHEYCETCYELGLYDDDQKCSSCLPEYQYDYLYFTNRANENPNICVPEGHFYCDNKLCDCGEEAKRCFNTTNNKAICFKNAANSECPDEYRLYNEDTKECFACD